MKGHTVVYSVSGFEGISYVTTKAEALRIARDNERAGDLVSVVKHVVTSSLPDRRALYCALLNGESWQKSQEDVPL